MIPRYYYNIQNLIEPGRALIIYGSRRVGKTTLINDYLKKTKLNYLLDSGDNLETQNILGSRKFSQILKYIKGYELIVIDEAQKIPNIGEALKIIVDQAPEIKVIATGSSSFELFAQVGEPLTGRKTTIILYPIAISELMNLYNGNEYTLEKNLNDLLIFGSYPEVLTEDIREKKIKILLELINSYLFKDILTLDNIKGSRIIFDILQLLSFQIGGEVSLNELATQLGVHVTTIARYLDLLEKSFVIYSLRGFSRNLRNEITNKNKYYFYDLGIRNAIINQFNDLDKRNDIGQLWENFLMTERMKKREYNEMYGSYYFWRTYEKKEIDLIEDREGSLFAYEFKWNKKKRPMVPGDWIKNYPKSEYKVITPSNYLDFVV